MPSAYFAWTMRPEIRATGRATFVVDADVEHRDAGMEGTSATVLLVT
jgi:hypothetical protein